MGRAIGTRAVAGGNEVEVIDRDPAEARALADELSQQGSATALEGAAIGGEVVVLALYHHSVPDAIQQYGEQLGGKIVVEITNPVDFETWDLVTPPGTSSAEEIAKLLPQDSALVKAFNTTFAPTLVAGEVGGQQLDVLIAGDDDSAKQKVVQLVEAGGLRPIDVGPLRRARQLEYLGSLHMALQQPMGWGFASAVKFHA
jgi:8-hydroxy-5-deazaflavin:NADPH oxidoreductase